MRRALVHPACPGPEKQRRGPAFVIGVISFGGHQMRTSANQKVRLLACVVTLGAAATAARAAVVETDSGPSTGTFTVSGTDLINGLTPATTGTFGPTSGDAFSTNDPAVLAD